MALLYSPLSFSPNITWTTTSPGPIVPSIVLTPTGPQLTTTFYNNTTFKPVLTMPLSPELNLNLDPEVHAQVTSYFYYKTLDDWLYDELLDLLSYLKIKDGKVDVIDKLESYNRASVDKDSQNEVDKKVKYIEKEILDKEDVFRVLKSYTRDTGTNWAELYKSAHFVRDAIKKALKKKLIKEIELKGHKN